MTMWREETLPHTVSNENGCDLPVFLRVFMSRTHARLFVVAWLVKVSVKDIPQLVLQIVVQGQGHATLVIVLTLAATVITSSVSLVSFVFFTIIPYLRGAKRDPKGDSTEAVSRSSRHHLSLPAESFVAGFLCVCW